MPRFYSNTGLTHKQKGLLCMIAKEAFDLQNNLGLTDELTFEQWRRQEQTQACGKSSLTKCVQTDYAAIKGHFQQLANKDDSAYHTYLKDDSKSQQQAQTFWHLEQQAELIGVLLVKAGRAKEKAAGKAYILGASKRILAQPQLTWPKIKNLPPEQIGNLVINAKRNLKSLQKKHPEACS